MEAIRASSPFGRFLLASLLVHAVAAAALYRADVDQKRIEATKRAGKPGLLLHLVRLPPGEPAAPAATPAAVARVVPVKPQVKPAVAAKPRPRPEPSPEAPAVTTPPEPAVGAPSAEGEAVASAVSAGMPGVATGPLAGTPGDGGDLEDALARYEDELARLISAHKRYPALARRRGIEGNVTLRLTIDADGRLAALDTPGRAPLVLAAQARSAAERAAPFPPPPNGELHIDFVLRFELDE